MIEDTLRLEVFTPGGDVLKERDIEEIVFRRKETRFEVGSEVAIFPQHGPTLIRLPVTPVRYQTHGQTHNIVFDGGYVEVKENCVLVVTPRFEQINPKLPDASDIAVRVAAAWRAERREFHEQMIGYEQIAKDRRP